MKQRLKPLGLIVASIVTGAFSSCIHSAPSERAQPDAARNVEIIQTATQVSVGFKNFDALTQRHGNLNASFQFNDPREKLLGRFEFDYTSAAARSHLVFQKQAGAHYHSVTLTLRDGKKKLWSQEWALPAVVEPTPSVSLSTEKSFVIPGTRTDAKNLPREIRLPDYSKNRELALPDAARRWNLEGSIKRVVADFNFPSMGSLNYSLFSLQTAHPDDRSKRSHYDSIKSTLYDQQTGAMLSTLKYLVEIPLDEHWRLGDGDLEVTIPMDKLGVHLTTEKVDATPTAERITDNSLGGLMQGTYAVACDDDGNLYFATNWELIRFNIKKSKFEKAPVHIVEFAKIFLPKLTDVPASADVVKSLGWTGSAHKFQICYGGNNRMYLSFYDSELDKEHLLCSIVMSVPTTHWDDAEAFKRECQLNAASWPTAEFPLYPTWIPPTGERRKLFHTLFIEGRACMLTYDKNHFWVMDVDETGATKQLLKLTTLDGRKINKFDVPSAAYAKDTYLGIQIPVEVGETNEKMEAFLAAGSNQFVVAPADKITSQQFMTYRSKSGARIHSGTMVYGVREYTKASIAEVFGKPDFGNGTVRVYYDVVEWLNKHPKGIEEYLAQMNGPSLGPQFLVSHIPGGGTKVLGNSEYGGYYFGYYDCANLNSATVKKTYLLVDAKSSAKIGSGANLGSYCHAWRKENGDDVLYYAGYTGLGRIPIRRDGQTLSRANAEGFAKKDESLDGAPPGYTKWFRDIIWGLGDKGFVTGVAEGGRGGTAYSGGLGAFHTGDPATLKRLTAMSSCHFSTRLDSRIVVTPGGEAAQEIYMAANFGITAGAEKVPANEKPKLFFYRDDGTNQTSDRFGFSLLPTADKGRWLTDYGVARNQLYGVASFTDGTLVTIDLQTHRFIDCVRVTNRVLTYSRNVNILNPMPDGTHVLSTINEADRSVTFHQVDVDAEGRLQFDPLLTCDLNRAPMYTGWQAGEFDFLADDRNQDGSYDIVMGAGYPYEEGARLYIIPDVIPPRSDHTPAK